jgi:hypothetical protein
MQFEEIVVMIRVIPTIPVAVLPALLVGVALTASGCAALGFGPSPTERDFGNSVRQMVQSQKANPAASLDPDPQALDVGDGPRLEGVLEGYRTTTVGERERVSQPIIIDVGG